MKTSEKVQPGSEVSPKLDGIYARATRDGLYSKSGRRIEGQDHLNRRLKLHFKLRPKSELRGELYRHGQSLEKTLSDYQSRKKLPLHMYPGQGPRPLPVLGVRRVRGKRVATQVQADAHYQKVLRRGYEGQVARAPNGTLTKRKPRADQEYKVAAVARGKKHGVLTVGDGSATFKVQAPARVAAQSTLGQQVTVSHAGKRPVSGVPRAPVFKAVRPYELQAGIHAMIEHMEQVC